MTLSEIRTSVAGYLGVAVSDLTVLGQDTFLAAVNQAVSTAELVHDFEHSRKLATVSVNGVTGGSLGGAVEYGTATAVDIKSVIEVGLFDDDANFRPVEWKTVATSLEEQRQDNPSFMPRYPTDGWARSGPSGISRFVFSGSTVFRFPKDSTSTFTLGMEVYAFHTAWTSYEDTVTVSGTLSPNATGTYSKVGTYNGYPLFKQSGGYFLWWDGTSKWILGAATSFDGSADVWTLTSSSQSPAGTYTAVSGNTGTPTVAAGTSVEDVWTKYASQYLIWQTIIFLNHRHKTFVPRQEGNLPPPAVLAQQGLEAFIAWDSNRYDLSQRHSR